jgi:hypothetical protein
MPALPARSARIVLGRKRCSIRVQLLAVLNAATQSAKQWHDAAGMRHTAHLSVATVTITPFLRSVTKRKSPVSNSTVNYQMTERSDAAD